jgi:hypothetical protein
MSFGRGWSPSWEQRELEDTTYIPSPDQIQDWQGFENEISSEKSFWTNTMPGILGGLCVVPGPQHLKYSRAYGGSPYIPLEARTVGDECYLWE